MFNHALQIQAKLVFTNETLLWNIVKPKPTVPHRSCFHSSEEDSGLSEALCDATVSQNKSFQKRMTEMTDEIFFLISEIYIFFFCSTRCAPNAEKLLKHPATRLKLHYIYDFYTLFFFFFFKDLVSTL